MKRLDPVDTDDAAEDIGLFKIDIDQLGGLALDIIDRSFNMNWL